MEDCEMRYARFVRSIAAVAVVLIVVSCGSEDDSSSQSPSLVYQNLMNPSATAPMVAAHRGFHILAPENTLASIRAAAMLGADFAEIDVRHTSDGVLVLMHDATVNRTTSGSGAVSALTYAQIQQLRPTGGMASDPETMRVPTFTEALSLARDVGIMLYVDTKTDRDDLMVATIREGSYFEIALVRDDLAQVLKMQNRDNRIVFMPTVADFAEFQRTQTAVANLKIVEYTGRFPNAALCAAIRSAGVKVQQDVIGLGDVPAMFGDLSGWKAFIESGVWLIQTDQPAVLMPLMQEYRRTGIFPDGL
jgi:glycerophosphoryl diester phosphodiesterase